MFRGHLDMVVGAFRRGEPLSVILYSQYMSICAGLCHSAWKLVDKLQKHLGESH